MDQIVIIGYGNIHRGDDGIGIRAAEQLADQIQDGTIKVLATQELRPEHAEVVSHADFALFLDACSQSEPGTVKACELKAAENGTGLFSHELTPQSVLTSAKVIYGRCPEAVLISVGGENFGISAHLTPRVQAALPQVIARAKEIAMTAKNRKRAIATTSS